jgi:hypothetical protein
MAMNYSGLISMGNLTTGQSIAKELGYTPPWSNLSLRTLSSDAGKASPDAMSEFYGYVRKSVTFSSSYTASRTSAGTTNFSGTVTIVGTSATFKAFSEVLGGTTLRIDTSINIGGNTRTSTRTNVGIVNSTTFTLTPGSYSYSGSVTAKTNGYGNGGISFTQA